MTVLRVVPVVVIALCIGSSLPGCRRDAEDARELESRLLAPCCYKQTLDVHASPLASEVKQRIRDRMAAGVPAAEVEAELVAEYGERVRAIPRRGYLDALGAGGVAAAGVALLGVVALGLRLRRRREAEAPPAELAPSAARRELEEELAALD